MKKALLLSALLFALNNKSQVFTAGSTLASYHDIAPDSLMWYRTYPAVFFTYSLNIFGTPGYEFMFKSVGSVSSGGSQAYIRIEPLRSDIDVSIGRIDSVWCPGCGMGGSELYENVAKPLMAGDTINSSNAIWSNNFAYLTDHTGAQGANRNVNDFVGGDKYVGLRYMETGEYGPIEHYGWVWVNCPSEDSCYVKAYASAARLTGISKNQKADIKIYPNPTRDAFIIEKPYENGLNRLSVQVTDLSGRGIPFYAWTNENGDFQVSLSTISSGLYFVTYEMNGKRSTHRLTKME
jgi:hypothetical protein